MGEIFSEEDYQKVLEKCRNFKDEYIVDPSDTVYVQLVNESESRGKKSASFDVYSTKLLNKIEEFASDPQNIKIPLFSYRFETIIEDKDDFELRLKPMAQTTNGWFVAEIVHKKSQKHDLYGELVCQCGEVSSSAVGIKLSAATGDPTITRIGDISNKLGDYNSNRRSERKPSGPKQDPNADVIYDLQLFSVGDANTARLINKKTNESVLIDCGIDRKSSYRVLYSSAENQIKALNPEYIFITHNHEDHYNLLFVSCSAQTAALGLNTVSALKEIIISGLNDIVLSGKINQTVLSSKLNIIHPTDADYEFTLTAAFPNVFINFGNAPDKSHCVEHKDSYFQNDTGMIVQINNKKNVLITGDCSYDFIPDASWISDADLIITPHHGGKVVMTRTVSIKKTCCAIVSSRYRTLYKGSLYDPNYDQGVYLRNNGLQHPLFFLQSSLTPSFTLHGI